MESDCCSFVLRRVRSAGTEYHAIDPSGRVRCRIRRRRWSIGRKMQVTDPDGNEIAEICRSCSPIVPKYRVSISGEAPFTVKRKLALSPIYEISGLGWHVPGSGGHYRGYAGESQTQPIFELYQDTGSWLERFSILVNDSRHSLRVICIAAAIDAAIDDIRRTRKS